MIALHTLHCSNKSSKLSAMVVSASGSETNFLSLAPQPLSLMHVLRNTIALSLPVALRKRITKLKQSQCRVLNF